jgi:hypothetical protein
MLCVSAHMCNRTFLLVSALNFSYVPVQVIFMQMIKYISLKVSGGVTCLCLC